MKKLYNLGVLFIKKLISARCLTRVLKHYVKSKNAEYNLHSVYYLLKVSVCTRLHIIIVLEYFKGKKGL